MHRVALLEELSRVRAHRLTLVAAPPGSGKTTLVAAWQHSERDQRPFAWLSIDRSDNDPVRFWTYLVEALRAVDPEFGGDVLAHIRVPGVSIGETVVPALARDAERLAQDAVLVLDDYHLIESSEIHEGLAALVELLPPRLHLVIATRSDPPLPIARLRVRGELLELRARDLRFDEEEAERFLNGALGLRLDGADIGRLRERTEGWAAGLYLAALSLRGRENAHDFIAAFAGNDRHVVDYLVSEVLDREAEALRTFLLRTSILERLSGPLCDAVLEVAGSQQTLEQLERSNLFVVPLDTTREWYRYHHLFADLLRHELNRSDPALAPALAPLLHRRASRWYRERGFVADAVHHALAADDVEAASDLIALHWNDFVNQGQLDTVAGWLDALPDDVVAGDARVCIARAGISLALGRRERVEQWLDAAEAAPAVNGVRFGASSIEAEAAIYRAVNRFMTGDVRGALEPARRAVELEQEDRSPWHAMAWAAFGRTLFWLHRPDEASAALAEAVRHAAPSSNNLSVIGALGYLACIRAGDGDHDAAEELTARALRMADEHRFDEHWVGAMALVARGKVLASRDERDAAEQAVTRAVELTRRGGTLVELVYALVTLAEISRARAERVELLEEARRVAGDAPEPASVLELVRRAERRAGVAARAIHAGEALSSRELAVLRLLATRRSLREIGASLFLSHNTIKSHTRSIYRKLDASTRGEAVERARELGLL